MLIGPHRDQGSMHRACMCVHQDFVCIFASSLVRFLSVPMSGSLVPSFSWVLFLLFQCDRFCLYFILICYILLFKKNKKYMILMMAPRSEWCCLHIKTKSLGKEVSWPRLMENDKSGSQSNKWFLEAYTGHRSWEFPLQGPSRAMNEKIQLFRTGINHFPHSPFSPSWACLPPDTSVREQ